MVKILRDEDADLNALKGKTISVIGYGSQGRAQALCMKDSGVNVIIGARNDETKAKAEEEGLQTMSIPDAAKKGDIIHILIPDEVQADVYEKEIMPYVKKGKTLSWSHGFNIVFKRIVPPADVDVIMVEPKAPGTEERKVFQQGFGVPALISVKQNPSGKAREIALAMAKSCGFTRAGVIECTFEQETYEDLFGEQAVLCGGLSELIKAGFETLVEAGYPPELAYFECLHEMKLIVDLVYAGGMTNMWKVVSNTAEYGGRTRANKIITPQVKENMKKILKDVESGNFAKEWVEEYKKGLPNLKRLREEDSKHQMEIVGKDIRKLFKMEK